MSRSLTPLQAISLGLVGLGAMVLLVMGFYHLGDRAGWAVQHYHLHVAFTDVKGLETGARVRLQGLDIGEVEALEPPIQPGQPVRVKLRIRERFQSLIPQDSRVLLASENVLGGKVLLLKSGSSSSMASEGDTLGAELAPDALENLGLASAKLNRVLEDVEKLTSDLRHGEEKGHSITQEMHQSVRKLNRVLESAERTLTQIEGGHGTLGKLIYDEKVHDELTRTMIQAAAMLQEFRDGQGTLGKLLKTNEAYGEALTSLQNFQRTMNSIKQGADAVKALPIVRGYVQEPMKALMRPECRRERRWLAEQDLFEPGQAVLTVKGRAFLDEAGAWLKENRDPKSEIVVASFTANDGGEEYVTTLTQKQSQVVSDYLRNRHSVHDYGNWFRGRPVRPVGCGKGPSPVPESEVMPAGRVEILLFVPQE